MVIVVCSRSIKFRLLPGLHSFPRLLTAWTCSPSLPDESCIPITTSQQPVHESPSFLWSEATSCPRSPSCAGNVCWLRVCSEVNCYPSSTWVMLWAFGLHMRTLPLGRGHPASCLGAQTLASTEIDRIMLVSSSSPFPIGCLLFFRHVVEGFGCKIFTSTPLPRPVLYSDS